MAERTYEEATVFVRRRPRWRRVAMFGALGLLAIILIAIVALWTQRRPLATQYLQSAFEDRGVQASYHLDRVGLRTQQISNLVIGDRKRPDLTARFAQIQTRIKWNGSV